MIDISNLKNEIFDQFETAELIGVTVDEIISNINNNQLPARKVGEKYFIKGVSIRSFLKKANVGILQKNEEK